MSRFYFNPPCRFFAFVPLWPGYSQKAAKAIAEQSSGSLFLLIHPLSAPVSCAFFAFCKKFLYIIPFYWVCYLDWQRSRL